MKDISKAVAGSHYSEAVRTLLAPEPEAKNPVRCAGILTLARLTAWMAVPCLIMFLSACGASKHIQTIPVETIKEIILTDTLYINNVQYDSIYINHTSDIDRTRDTIKITETMTEYRYKLLRDTIYKTKIEAVHDSIPYEVRITEVKEVKYIPPWIKPLAHIGIITILVLLFYAFTKLKRF